MRRKRPESNCKAVRARSWGLAPALFLTPQVDFPVPVQSQRPGEEGETVLRTYHPPMTEEARTKDRPASLPGPNCRNLGSASILPAPCPWPQLPPRVSVPCGPHRDCACPCGRHPSGTQPAGLSDTGLMPIGPAEPPCQTRSHSPQRNSPWKTATEGPHGLQATWPPATRPDTAGLAQPGRRPVPQVKPATEPGPPDQALPPGHSLSVR